MVLAILQFTGGDMCGIEQNISLSMSDINLAIKLCMHNIFLYPNLIYVGLLECT